MNKTYFSFLEFKINKTNFLLIYLIILTKYIMGINQSLFPQDTIFDIDLKERKEWVYSSFSNQTFWNPTKY